MAKKSGSRSAGKTQSISSRGGNRGGGNRSASQSGGGRSSGRTGGNQGSRSGGEGMIDNLTYDIITVLHKKSKALEAYDKYLQDAQGREEVRDILEEIRDQDQEHVQRLTQCLRELLSGEGMEQEEAA
ncbi:MAG: hypothetical protein JWO13_74 [Acidobacteriales bacterium]|nr:hypothetical protein [Terriglobales bacterium]